jgi:O-antigen ligase
VTAYAEMDKTPSYRLTFPKTNVWLLGAGVFAYVVLLMLLLSGYHVHLLVVLGFGVASYLASRFPLSTVLALLITGVLPTVFQTTPIFSEDYGQIGRGFNADNVVVLSMLGAVLLKTLRSSQEDHNSLGLLPYIVAFTLLLLFEILRNVGTYGLSAPGEFRYTYLILAVPLYVALFFRTTEQREKLFKLLVFSSLGVPLLSLPIIRLLKNWEFVRFGTVEGRFLPAHISLGLVYAFTALVLARKYHLVKIGSFFLWLLAVPVLFIVFLDSHRSVWLASGIMFVSLVWLREIRFRRIWSWSLPLLILLVCVWYGASAAGLDVFQYAATRSTAIVSPEEDQDAAWRMAIWAEQSQKIAANPIIGEGFGTYWEVNLPELKTVVTASPHNLYVQTLLKLGVIGLLAYLVIVYRIFSRSRSWIRSLTMRDSNPEAAIVLTGVVVLIGAHWFYLAYAFEYYSWLFIGLGVAALRNRGTYRSDK